MNLKHPVTHEQSHSLIRGHSLTACSQFNALILKLRLAQAIKMRRTKKRPVEFLYFPNQGKKNVRLKTGKTKNRKKSRSKRFSEFVAPFKKVVVDK